MSTQQDADSETTEYPDVTSQPQDIQEHTTTSFDVDDSNLARTTDSPFEIDELIPVNTQAERRHTTDIFTTSMPEITTDGGSGDVGSGLDVSDEYAFSTEQFASGDGNIESTTVNIMETTDYSTSETTEDGSGDIESEFLTTDKLIETSSEFPDEQTSVVGESSSVATANQFSERTTSGTSALPEDGSGDVGSGLDYTTQSPETTSGTGDEDQTTFVLGISEESSRTIEDETTTFSVEVSTQSTPQSTDISDDGSGDSSGDVLDLLTTQEHIIFDLSTGGITTEDAATSEVPDQETTTVSQMETTDSSVDTTFIQDSERNYCRIL